MAGGMPRDVLRMARTMLDLHRQSLDPSGLADLAERLVALEIQAVKRGFQQHPEAQADTALPGLLVDPAWPGRTSEDLRLAAEDRLASAPAMAAALLYYSTVLYVFADRPYVLRRWLKSLDRPGESTSVAGLTFAHRLLATDPAVAVQQLRRVRAYLGRG
jgi:hypothetical protein